MSFLSGFTLRPLSGMESERCGHALLAIGNGPHALEVVVVECSGRPTASLMRQLWRERLGSRVVPLLVVGMYDGIAALCGPAGRQAPVWHDLPVSQVERLCATALREPNRHQALRFLRDNLPEVDAPIPGIRNSGLVATHELVTDVPRRQDWQVANQKGNEAIPRRGRALLEALGYDVVETTGPVSILVADDTKTAIGVVLDRSERIEVASERFSGSSPVSYGLARATQERLPYVLILNGGRIRLYPAEAGVGVGQRGRADTYVEVHVDLLPEDKAGYLWLLLSSSALAPGGSFEDILERSADYVSDLGLRLRERIYRRVVPQLAKAVFNATGVSLPDKEQLEDAYEMALTVLFRLLFLAYAEDKDLLPYRENALYRARSLKQKARELLELSHRDVGFGQGHSLWNEVSTLWEAVSSGKPEWGVPAYDGGLFSSEASISRMGNAISEVALPDTAFGPVLHGLLLDQSPDGVGPIDFRSLGVRDFGTIYEGLLESELSVARENLTVDDDGFYTPASDRDNVQVDRGEVYLHNSSGSRKATGSYYTKSFAVDHLLDHSLEPALEEHLTRLDSLEERDAGEAFFDFHVADSCHGFWSLPCGGRRQNRTKTW